MPFESRRPTWINGQPGGVFVNPNGRAVLLVALDIAADLVQAVRAISNPYKLRHLASSTSPDR